MGYPGKSRKSYSRPRNPFQAERIAQEVEMVKSYRAPQQARAVEGPRRSQEVSGRPAATLLAAVAVGRCTPEAEAILRRLKRLGVLKEEGDLGWHPILEGH